MIEEVVARWEAHLRGEVPLSDLLDDDVVFYSPIVFTPQRGKEITTTYLQAAAAVFLGESSDGSSEGTSNEAQAPAPSSFHYTKKVMSGDTAVLEFETSMGGTFVNGIDMIRCNDEGLIVEFRVMIRPLKAVEAVHAQMRAALGL